MTSASAGAQLDQVTLARLPLAFILNAGQTDATVRYLARGMGGTIFFTPDEAKG